MNATLGFMTASNLSEQALIKSEGRSTIPLPQSLRRRQPLEVVPVGTLISGVGDFKKESLQIIKSEPSASLLSST